MQFGQLVCLIWSTPTCIFKPTVCRVFKATVKPYSEAGVWCKVWLAAQFLCCLGGTSPFSAHRHCHDGSDNSGRGLEEGLCCLWSIWCPNGAIKSPGCSTNSKICTCVKISVHRPEDFSVGWKLLSVVCRELWSGGKKKAGRSFLADLETVLTF